MKLSHITIITLLSINLLADGVPNQRIYEEAQKSYNAGDFKTAYGMFESLSLEFPDNAEFNFLLGRSALELKMYDQAITAFDRVLMLNPSHTRTHLELARLYYEQRRFESAQIELELVLKENIPQNIRDVALSFKSRIEDNMVKHRFSVALIVGGGYDDNANNGIGRYYIPPALQFLSIMDPTWKGVPGDKQRDSHLFSTMVLSHSYDFGEKGGWSIDNALVGYSKMNDKLKDNNLLLFSLSSTPIWSESHYKLSMPLGYDRVYLDGQGYMYNLSASIKGAYLIDATSQVEIGYLLKRGFYDEDEAQDVQGNTYFASYKKAFGEEEPIIISLSTSYTDNAEVNSGRTDVSSTENSYSVELSKIFKNGFRTSLSYAYSTTDFKKVNATYYTKRNDSRDEYELGLGYSLKENLLLNASVIYAKNHSNHDPFNYDKTTALLTAMYTF